MVTFLKLQNWCTCINNISTPRFRVMHHLLACVIRPGTEGMAHWSAIMSWYMKLWFVYNGCGWRATKRIPKQTSYTNCSLHQVRCENIQFHVKLSQPNNKERPYQRTGVTHRSSYTLAYILTLWRRWLNPIKLQLTGLVGMYGAAHAY